MITLLVVVYIAGAVLAIIPIARALLTELDSDNTGDLFLCSVMAILFCPLWPLFLVAFVVVHFLRKVAVE